MPRKNAFYIQTAELVQLAATYTTIDTSIELRWIEQEDQHLIIDCPHRSPSKSWPEFVERHYADKGRICAAFVDGDLVAWRLFKPHFQTMWDWLEVLGADGVVFGLAAYTAPHARGKRLMTMITAHAAREYAKLGYTVLMAATDQLNDAAVSAHSHIGMHRFGLIEATRWPLGFRTVRINGKLRAGFFNHRRRLIHHVS
jgi:GNAT superfamily N-acetyltransferase